MKVLFTGGGSGGHFYPLIAIAQELNPLIAEAKLMNVKLYFMSVDPYNERLLFQNNIKFKKISTGKRRTYFSLKNYVDIVKTVTGTIKAVAQMLFLFPDVVVGKGGYASFPAIFAARFYKIPLIIHESDAVPGRVNAWAGKFADKVAISFAEAAQYFPAEKVALTGNPIRREILVPVREGAREALGLDQAVPTLLILGGSQGSQRINETVLEVLPRLTAQYQVIHQTGAEHFENVRNTASALLTDPAGRARYKVFSYFDDEKLRLVAGVSDLVVSRAGSMIFEIAAWGIPSLLIPITESNGDHQRKNAFAYARTGAAEVIAEANLTPNLLASEIERILSDRVAHDRMAAAAAQFAKKDAAAKIAHEILAVLLAHAK